MFTIEETAHSGYYRVTGYPNGSDWLLGLSGRWPSVRVGGAAGPEHVWFFDDRSATLYIFHALERRQVAALQIGKPNAGTLISSSRNGRWLYALVEESVSQRILQIIDVTRGTIVSSHHGFPAAHARPVVERPDGRLLISFAMRNGDAPAQGMILFDPLTGERPQSLVTDHSGVFGFQSASPDGRYWIKSDCTHLPRLDVGGTSAGMRLGGEHYYGLVVQLWEAFPLRFIRRLVVCWLRAEELPVSVPIPDEAMRQAMWSAIARATTQAPAGPLEAVRRSAFPDRFATDEYWPKVMSSWVGLTNDISLRYRWQPDSGAFWVTTRGFLSCVGIDGPLSPRVYAARQGLEFGTVVPVAKGLKDVIPLQDRKARAVYHNGSAILDGAASRTAHQWREIPREGDQWVATDVMNILRRISAMKDERKKIIIPLSAWSEAGCTAAIDALTAEIKDGFGRRAVDGDIRAIFVKDGEEFDEKQFFMTVRERFPRAAPAIRRMLERLADVTPRYAELFWKGEGEGIGIFGHGAQALGAVDHSGLSTLRRYARLLDLEHEQFFALETVPAIIRTHGWTDDVIDFVVYVLLVDFYNSLHDHNVVWNDWGLRDAVVQRYQPDEFARRVANEIDAGEFWDLTGDHQARYGNGSMDQFAAQIPEPHEPWLEEFFAELERIADEKRGATVS